MITILWYKIISKRGIHYTFQLKPETDTCKGEDDTTLNDNDDVFEKDNSSITPVFYLSDENASDEPKNKKIKDQTQTSRLNTSEANKENVLVKPHKTHAKPDASNRDDLNENVASVNDDEKKPTNRICLHAPLSKKDDSKVPVEDADTSVSPGIFLEYIENEEKPQRAFQREEREPTPFFKTNNNRKEIESPYCNKLQPITPSGSSAFEREPTPFFDETKCPQSHYLEDNSSSESSPDREVEAIEKPRSHFLTVPTKAAFTFEGPVRAPRDSTPTPFQGNNSASDPMLDTSGGLRPPRESTPFFPKEEGNTGPNKGEAEESQCRSTKSIPEKDTSVERHQSGTKQSKAKADLPLSTEGDSSDNTRNSRRHKFDQINRQKQLSSENAVNKNIKDEGVKLGHSVGDTLKTPIAKITGNSQKDAMAQPLNITSETEKRAAQMSPKSHKHSQPPADAKISNSPDVAAQKAAAAQARKELYRQRKLQMDLNKNIESKRTFASKEEATPSQTSMTHCKSSDVYKGEGIDLTSPKPLFKAQQSPGFIKSNQQSVIQCSLPLPKLGQNPLTSMPLDQAELTENTQKLNSATMTRESPSKTVPYSRTTLNSSMSNTKTQQMALASKSSELPKPTKLITSSATSTKTITPATMVVKPPPPTPVSLAKASVVTSTPSNPKRGKRSPPPKPTKDPVSRSSPKPQDRIDTSNTSKKMELCKLTQLPLPSSRSANVNHPRGMLNDIQNPKPKTSPSALKSPVSLTAMKTCKGSSQGEKGASCMPTSAIKSVLSSSSKTITTSAPTQLKSLSSVPKGTQPSLKPTLDQGGEYVGDKNVSHKVSKASNSTPTHMPHTRLCESSQRKQPAQQALIFPKPANFSSIDPVSQSPFTGIQNKMPICHRLEVASKNKSFTLATEKPSPGIVRETRDQNITYYSTLWSKLLKAFMNSFVNEVPISKEEIRKPTKRRKAEKSKDPRTSKSKSKISRGNSCDCDWTSVSPFGYYTLEGVFLVCTMTLIALSADVGVEVFICYILAAYYTFFVLRVLQILD